jgi:hypothetical protein
VVTPASIDASATAVDVADASAHEEPPLAEGCPAADVIARDADRLAEALTQRFGTPFEASADAEGRITARPRKPLRAMPGAAKAAFDVITTAFPDSRYVYREAFEDGPPFVFYVQLVNDDVVAHGLDAVVEVQKRSIASVRVERGRIIRAFAPLLRVPERAARSIAEDHVIRVMHRPNVHAREDAELAGGCDEMKRAASLRWVVYVEAGPGISMLRVAVDAKTGAVTDVRE